MLIACVRWIFTMLFTKIWGLKIYGRERVPMTGGAIVVANHRSNWDPLIVGVALPRMVYFMAKEELFRNYFLGMICRILGAFPLQRGKVDKVAMRTAFGILQRGDLLGIFPEGTRIRRPGLGRFHSGAASLALRLGMPLIPIALIGTDRMGKGGLPIAVIGEPITVEKGKPTPERVEEVNNIIRNEIEKMQEAHRSQ